MKPVLTHRPGAPSEPEPPEQLVNLAANVQDPLVKQTGLTTTTDGRWALYVTVPVDATVPIAGVQQQAGGFPVVYEAEAAEPPRARPARPKRKRPEAS